MHAYAHSSTSHSSQDVDTTSISRGTDKEDAAQIYTGYYSATQNNEIMPFTATGMDPEMIILRSKSDRDKYHIPLLCRIQNMIQANLFTKQKQTHRLTKQTYRFQRGRARVGGRDEAVVWN